MNRRNIMLASLTVINVIAIALFLDFRFVAHYSIFTSIITTGAITIGIALSLFLGGVTVIQYEIMKGKGNDDHE